MKRSITQCSLWLHRHHKRSFAIIYLCHNLQIGAHIIYIILLKLIVCTNAWDKYQICSHLLVTEVVVDTHLSSQHVDSEVMAHDGSMSCQVGVAHVQQEPSGTPRANIKQQLKTGTQNERIIWKISHHKYKSNPIM